MILMLVLWLVLGYPITRYYFRFPTFVCVALVIAFLLIFILSFYYEKRSVKKYNKLKNDIINGTYEKSDEWNDNYFKFVSEEGFENIKYSSMKKDLFLRYIRIYNLFWIIFGIGLLILNFVIVQEIDLMIFLVLVSICFISFGVFRLYPKNVKAFLKKYTVEYSDINTSYLDGNQLTYKKVFSSISDTSSNCGINIGSSYVVVFNQDEIFAIKYSDIQKVNHKILSTRFYGNGMYTGTVWTHHIRIEFHDDHRNTDRIATAQLNEFQTELACETLDKHINSPVLYHNKIDVDV